MNDRALMDDFMPTVGVVFYEYGDTHWSCPGCMTDNVTPGYAVLDDVECTGCSATITIVEIEEKADGQYSG